MSSLLSENPELDDRETMQMVFKGGSKCFIIIFLVVCAARVRLTRVSRARSELNHQTKVFIEFAETNHQWHEQVSVLRTHARAALQCTL